MRLFGPTHGDIWRVLSEDIGAKFILEDSVFKKYKVIKEFHNWVIVLDTYNSNKKNEPVYSRVYCAFLNKNGFKFKVFDEYFNNYFSSFFDMQDIKVDYANLKDKFIIRSNSEVGIKRFLQNSTIRELLNMQSDILLEVVNDEGYEVRDNASSTLSVKIPGIIKNNEILKNLFELIGEGILEIEKISDEIENLEVNNFTHFDVIKNSVKNTLLESIPYNRLKKDIVDNVNKAIYKTSHYNSHKENETNKAQLVSKKLINKNQIKEVSYTENSNKEIKDKPICDYTDNELLLVEDENVSEPMETKITDRNNLNSDMSNLSVDTSGLKIDTSNLKVDTSSLKIDSSYLNTKE